MPEYEVHVSYENERGCGFRSPGADGVGIYLMGAGVTEPCERLPFPLTVCPTCGGGIHPARGFTWIDPMTLFDPYNKEPLCNQGNGIFPFHRHEQCWLCNPELLGSMAGLIWIGERFYPSTYAFTEEAGRMGISRKLSALPNGFEIGTHVVFLAHKKAIWSYTDGEEVWKAGVFMAYKPVRVDLVIENQNEIPDKAINLMNRLGENGRIVKVVKNVARQGEMEDA